MPWLTDRRLLAAALVAWAVVAAIGVALGPPLGHDEAAFAITGRGDAPAGAWLYRSEGTVALARLGIALGGAAWQLRLASAVLGLGVVIAAFAVGRAAFSARTGAWAAALVAGAHPMAMRSAQLLSDLPAAACILGGIAVTAGELGRATGPRWRIVAAAPLFAAAFYVRYGSAPVVGLALAAAGILWWRAVLARPVRVLVTLGLFAALLVPHLVRSIHLTGSALGVLEVSAGIPRRAYIGEGLVTYLTSNPLDFYGALIAPVMVAGVVGLVRARRRASWYLGIVALGQIAVLGLQSHGQPRYVFVATVLLVVLGVDVVARIGRPRLAVAALGAVAAAWLGVAVATIVTCRIEDQRRAPIVRAGQVLRADAGGRPCAVVAALAPQLTWYSGCEVFLPALLDVPLPADRPRYAASFTRWPIDLPTLLAVQRLRATPLLSGDPDARIWRLE